MMLLLHCPQCRNNMKYRAMDKTLAGKVKRCVYCGRSFRVKSHVLKVIS